MKVIEYTYPANRAVMNDACYALGFFDGVHIGHRKLVSECIKRARALGLTPAVFTFPSECEELKRTERRLYSTEDKLSILESLGIECTVVADFRSVSSLHPEKFISDVLVGELGCAFALSGEGFRFGVGASGDTALLKRCLEEHGAGSDTVADVQFDGMPASSTRIREALGRSDVALAKKMLAAPFFIRGRVEHGRGAGRTFGIPTVNIPFADDTPLANGVYHTELDIDGKVYTGLTNIGVCPTFGERRRHSETLILDYSGDLYERELTVQFIDFLREEKTFGSVDELKKQIDHDIRRIKNGRSMD